MRIIFAGTPQFAAVALQAILDAGFQVVAVYTQPDRPAGRGRKLSTSPVKQLAVQQAIPVQQPLNFKQADALQTLAQYEPDVMVVAAYGLLLPVSVLETPRLGCLNIHASLLPRWRGAAPIQRAIAEGDEQTGITIMQMNAGLDTGDMLLKKVLPIKANDTSASLHDQLAQLGGEAIVQALNKLAHHELVAEAQDDTLSSYAKKLQKEEAWIDWSSDVTQIDRQIRAFNPWPVCQTALGDTIIRIHQASILNETEQGPAGKILGYSKQGIDVQCGQGQLRITQCQLPGKRALGVAELFNGQPELLRSGLSFSKK